MNQAELKHFGVLGMHWGVHKSPLDGVSNKTFNEAGKDAKEHTKAKMFYGEGAGTRRKLIKAKVESKMKKDPAYKKAFEHHIANTDLGKRAEQARSERARKDAVATTAKTARGFKNLMLGTGANVTIAAAAAYGTYRLWQNPAVRATVKRVGSARISDVQRIYNAAKLHKMGF